MKLLSAAQLQLWDAFTVQHTPIASLDLMERAAQSCTHWLLHHGISNGGGIRIFCGKGNNGGDGLAIARQLAAAGLVPTVYILEFGARGTDNFQANLQRLHGLPVPIYFIQDSASLPELHSNDCLIDALYGSGLNRPLSGLSEAVVQHMNAAAARVIAIDIPSGMYTDRSAKGHPMVRATHTLTFEVQKLCFMAPENAPFFGAVNVLPIGLHPAFTHQAVSAWQMMYATLAQALYRPRSRFAHKGTHGHALLVAGSKGKMGASVLAARACLRTGAGLLTVNTPECGYAILQTAVPEAMTLDRETMTSDLTPYKTIGIGPGLGTGAVAEQLLRFLLQHFNRPIVVDADALNLLAQHPELLGQLPAGSILSPHPKEFDRLFGEQPNDFERMEKALSLSLEHPFVYLLKGHHTLIAWQGKGYFNTTGNAGMAKGGSGDVLTGMLTALLAQSYSGFQAALLGVYLHGLAADIALGTQSMESLLPGDIIEYLGAAFNQLNSGQELETAGS